MKNFSISRRQMLGSSAALGLSALIAPASVVAATGSNKQVPGVQLYTVRASMATDVPGTLRAIAGIGYQEVEFAGYFDQTPQQIRELLDDLGLSSPSVHIDAPAMRDDPMPLIEAAKVVGHDYLTVAWLSPDDRQSIDDYKRWAEAFNRAGEMCRDNGMRLAYHNHDFEFTPIDGQVPFDILLNETDAELFDLEIDMFWVRKAEQDIVDVLKRAPDRFTMAHIKDMDERGNMTEVGSGVIDFASVLENESASGLRHLFVEHDQPTDAFKSVAMSHLSLASILD
jgi:sugar phosphate isomerase/epimerase